MGRYAGSGCSDRARGQQGYPELADMVHADDRERYAGAERDAIEKGFPNAVEFRLVRANGAVCWLRSEARSSGR